MPLLQTGLRMCRPKKSGDYAPFSAELGVVYSLGVMAPEPHPITLPICPHCGKPRPLEDCVVDSQGRAAHKECYRLALIQGREKL
jgi:hypothetical protein